MAHPPIVVGVEFSESGEAAFESACNLARDLGAPLVLVHAFPGRFLAPGPEHAIMGLAVDAETVLEEDDAVYLSTEWGNRARLLGLDVTCIVRDGAPDKVLAEVAEEQNAALIIVGNHVRSGLRRLALGSTAGTLVRNSKRPVLTIPMRAPLPPQTPGPPMLQHEL